MLNVLAPSSRKTVMAALRTDKDASKAAVAETQVFATQTEVQKKVVARGGKSDFTSLL